MKRTRTRLQPVTVVGLVFLVVAGITRFLLERHSAASEHVIDPVVGVLYGIAIGAMLVSLWRQTNHQRGSGSTS